MNTEADTCRKYVVPKLVVSGWDSDPHSIAEQRTITDGRVIPIGKEGFVRKPPKRVDYLLRYTRDFPLAVVEAKASYRTATDAVQQARTYAEMLGLKFAYATNGAEIIEIDYFAGTERLVPDFPKPDELWHRYQTGSGLTGPEQADQLIAPYNIVSGKAPRYYQQIAINCTVESILGGKRRLLLTMATGTGKTIVAFQICWKLWSSRWNRAGEYRKPRILYLADRNILIDDPKDKTFTPFGDARYKIESGEVVKSREMYFAIYQALAEDERRAGLFRDYPPDFFDLIIVDECHRGSAREDSSWRVILEHFKPAFQLGMTATPLREDNRDTYLYFGNPIYQYSLRQGIDDGFLAPYRVHRVVTQWDAAGWRPSKDEVDRYGREIPDDEYQTRDFERVIALRARTQAIAKHLTDFLKKTDRFAKTIVFCVDQEHASEMRQAMINLNSDLVAQYPDYVARVTSDEKEIGRGHLSRFQDLETKTPTILTSSQLLTTGVDAPTCKNVVLVRVVGSMSEFKQIIGRGTRLRDDYPALIDSMQKLTLRGIALRRAISDLPCKPRVIESYPGAAQDIFSIPRKQKGLELLREGLRRLGLRGKGLETRSHDEMDAITSAVVGRFYEAGQFEPMGIPSEAQLIVPKVPPIAFENAPIICLAGKTGAGKSVVARYLSVFYGFRWIRTRDVIRDLLIEDQLSDNGPHLFNRRVHPSGICEADLQEFGAMVLNTYKQVPLRKKLAFMLTTSPQPCVVDSIRDLVDVEEDVRKKKNVLIWFIDCSESTIQARLRSKKKFADQRISTGSPVDWTAPIIREHADQIILNNSSLEDLRWRIDDQLFDRLELISDETPGPFES